MKPTSKWAGKLLVALTALAGAGCVLLEKFSGPLEVRYAFNHQVHVVGEKLECVSCHESADMSDDPGLPSLDTCTACHATLDAGKPPDKRVESLFEEGKFKAARASVLDKEQIFSHKRHVAANQDCGSCHAGIDTNRRITADIGVAMERCMDCHAERRVANGCETCHTVIRTDWAPEIGRAHV